MHFLPILSTLRRHRTASVLIVVEIALTCAIVCNAIFLIRERLSRMDGPSGIVEEELLRVRITGIGERSDASAITVQDLQALRGIAGVKYAAATNMVPFGGSSWNSDISTIKDDPEGISAGMYMGTQDLLETLGVKLIAGRDFNPEEYVELDDVRKSKASMSSIILTRGAAERLFRGKSALGQPVYVWGDEPQTVVGVVDQIARPNEGNGIEYKDYSVFLPLKGSYGDYLIRVDPSRATEVLGAVDATLDKVDPNRIILDRQRFSQVRAKYFEEDRSMA